MPATPNLRGKRLSATGYRPSVGLEALEPRALLSAAPVNPAGDAGSMADLAAVSAMPSAPSQPANRAEAIAEAMKTLGLDAPTPVADSSATTPTVTPSAATGHTHKRKRAKPHAIRAHGPTPSTATPSTTTNRVTVAPVLLPNYPGSFEREGSVDDATDSVLRADLASPSVANLPATSRSLTTTVQATLADYAPVASHPKAPEQGAAALQLSHAASLFSTARITQSLVPVIATRLARSSAAAVLGLASGNLPDWLLVGPQGQYVFTDRELFFKAGAMVLSVAGLVAGYCGYLQVTRARRQAEARAKVEIYSLFGWQESF